MVMPLHSVGGGTILLCHGKGDFCIQFANSFQYPQPATVAVLWILLATSCDICIVLSFWLVTSVKILTCVH